MNDHGPAHNQSPALFVGVDWADKSHDCFVIGQDGRGVHEELEHSPEAIDAWVNRLIKQADGRPIAVMLELSRGPLVAALAFRDELQLYSVNPKQFASYRESFPGGDNKNDPSDAAYLAQMLRERIDTLQAWRPDDQQTRQLAGLCEQRRKAVDRQTKLRQQLISVLKSYFPLALELFGSSGRLPLLLEILGRWSDPRKFRRADRRLVKRVLREHRIRNDQAQAQILERIRNAMLLCDDDALIAPLAMTAKSLAAQIQLCQRTIDAFNEKIDEVMAKHPDANLFTALRGAGKALAPRLTCGFGSDRGRWKNADEFAAYCGAAPLTRQSGNQRQVVRRRACPKHLRQTFHEFADSARKWCPWSKAKYRLLRDRGMKHHAALRKLARCWIRILYKVWLTRTPFDPERYINNIKQRCPEIVPYLAAA